MTKNKPIIKGFFIIKTPFFIIIWLFPTDTLNTQLLPCGVYDHHLRISQVVRKRILDIDHNAASAFHQHNTLRFDNLQTSDPHGHRGIRHSETILVLHLYVPG
jgi:hypothetical protein